jgi:hypothetical protein
MDAIRSFALRALAATLIVAALLGLPTDPPVAVEAPSSVAPMETMTGHHHIPHHGGQVGMVGMLHVEALAARDGSLRVYLSDLDRRPLPMPGVFGKATAHFDTGDVVRALGRVATPSGPALGGRFDELRSDRVDVELDLVVAGEPYNIEFVLPVGGTNAAPAPMPARCRPPIEAGVRRRPHCTIDLGRAVSALDVAPDATVFVIGAVDLPVTAWSLVDGRRLASFQAPIDSAAVAGRPAHASAPNAVRLRPPSGRDALVAVENRLLLYETRSGKLRRELAAAEGIVMDARWKARGGDLVTFLAYRPQLWRLGLAAAAHERIADLGVNVVAIAAAVDGDRMAAATSDSHVAVLETSRTTTTRVLAQRTDRPLTRISALAFAGGRLLAATRAGEVEAWDLDSGELSSATDGMRALVSMAAAPDGRTVAVGDADGGVHLLEVPSLVERETLGFHDATVTALSWQGEYLVSGDEGGRVAVWRLPR